MKTMGLWLVMVLAVGCSNVVSPAGEGPGGSTGTGKTNGAPEDPASPNACTGAECPADPSGANENIDPTCRAKVPSFGVDAFRDPVVHCAWTGAKVMTTPLVADLDQDGQPEVVFAGDVGDLQTPNTYLFAIRGSDCTERWRLHLNDGSNLYTQPAVADLDADGKAEIAVAGRQTVWVVGHDGKVRAQTPSENAQTVAIANIDGSGPPEIVSRRAAYRYEAGVIRKVVDYALLDAAGSSDIPLIADLNGDGKAELISGLRVMDATTGTPWSATALDAVVRTHVNYYFPALADFNGDGARTSCSREPCSSCSMWRTTGC